VTAVLLPLAPAAPFALALALLVRPLVRPALALAPWAVLPALALALFGELEAPVVYPELLLGTQLGLDATGRAFLLAAAALWLAGGVYARAYLRDDPRERRFTVFFLLSATGNVGLVVAADAVTFYLGFGLMTVAAYGLVVHDGTARALSAGRYYVALAVGAEALLLSGLMLAARAAGTISLAQLPAGIGDGPATGLAAGLLLAGLGVKAGVVPLHVWLPLAHPVAPTPASAVLSGAMIKAGLLGWLRFLPLGEAELPGWGAACVALGLATAFYGVAAGLGQDDAKTVLAYSSVSQMGLALLAVGAALVRPDAWALAAGAATFQAVQHGLAKGALFLGVGVVAAAAGRRARRAALGGLAVCALALAGAPLTAGAVAKSALERPLGDLGWGWPTALLPLTAAGTALLLGRFLVLARREALSARAGAPVGMWAPWTLLVAASVAAAWAVPAALALPGVAPYRPTIAGALGAAWPVAAGAALLLAAAAAPRVRRAVPRVPAGDLGLPAASGLEAAVTGAERLLAGVAAAGLRAARAAGRARPVRRSGAALAALEARLLDLAVAGVALLAVGLAVVALLGAGGLR
jgi:formate hydrogenlyase subunit 3/multisubunit Na+/H+ antiporter MnhD subunit